jgi:outer membrane protein OmpA-like peptidoglycan-associated protein
MTRAFIAVVLAALAAGCAATPAPPVAAPMPAPSPPTPPAAQAPGPYSDKELADELAKQGVGVPRDAPTAPPRAGEDIPTEIRQTPRGVVVTFRDVLFAFDSTQLTPQARREIERMAFVLNHPQAISRRITLEGYTDSIGTDAYNLELSRRRAASVAEELVARGVARARLGVDGLGKQRPVSPNMTPDGKDNPAGRALNRRVEAVVQALEAPR